MGSGGLNCRSGEGPWLMVVMVQHWGSSPSLNPTHRLVPGAYAGRFDPLLFARFKVGKGWATSNKRAGHSQESLYARYTSKYPKLAAQPVDCGALETYDAHNAVDDCRALLKLMKAIDEYLGSSCL